MAKYDLYFKLGVVRAYLAGEGGHKALAKRFGLPSKSVVKKWINIYEAFGESALERKKSAQKYSVQFKLDVLNYKLRTGESYLNVALKFGMHEPSIISVWMSNWQKEGIPGLSKAKGRPTMSKQPKQNKKDKELTKEQLERENELLRAENAYLKKLRASGINIPSRLQK